MNDGQENFKRGDRVEILSGLCKGCTATVYSPYKDVHGKFKVSFDKNFQGWYHPYEIKKLEKENMEKEIEIQVGNEKYIVDLEKAKQLGVIKRKELTSFDSGDVFKTKFGTTILVLEIFTSYKSISERYQIFGLDGQLKAFSDFNKLQTKQQILDLLNRNEYLFVKNVNDTSEKLFK